MNLTNIDWCQFTWNPITGCLHDCGYCYARGLAKRFLKAFPNGFKPTFHPERLNEPAKEKDPAHIFTVSMGDMFGDWVPSEWIDSVFRAMHKVPQHQYTILTKNPGGVNLWLSHYDGPMPGRKVMLGTSFTGGQDFNGGWRLADMERLSQSAFTPIVSLEPFLSPIPQKALYVLDWAKWIIIGGLTGPRKFQPPAEWIDPIIEWAHNRSIPVFVKRNTGYAGAPQEYPEGVMHGEVKR